MKKMAENHCKVNTVLKDNEVDQKKTTLKLLVRDGGWAVLWQCPLCDRYWEATWEGRYAEREYLTCLEDEEVRLRYADKIGGK